MTALGAWDGPNGTNGSVGDGLLGSHWVTVLPGGHLSPILAQATIPAGTTAPITDGFRYVSLVTPVLLVPGNYLIGDQAAYGFFDAFAYNASTISSAPGVTYQGWAITTGKAFGPDDTTLNGYFGPNFQFILVPEPSTVMLFLLGIAATFGLKFFVRGSAQIGVETVKQAAGGLTC